MLMLYYVVIIVRHPLQALPSLMMMVFNFLKVVYITNTQTFITKFLMDQKREPQTHFTYLKLQNIEEVRT